NLSRRQRSSLTRQPKKPRRPRPPSPTSPTTESATGKRRGRSPSISFSIVPNVGRTSFRVSHERDTDVRQALPDTVGPPPTKTIISVLSMTYRHSGQVGTDLALSRTGSGNGRIDTESKERAMTTLFNRNTGIAAFAAV